MTKKHYHLPKINNTDGQFIFREQYIAQFEYIKCLYALEEHKPLRIAFTLRKHLSIPATLHELHLNIL